MRFAKASKEYPIIMHETRSGKTLYNVMRRHLNAPEAKAINPHFYKVHGTLELRNSRRASSAAANLYGASSVSRSTGGM